MKTIGTLIFLTLVMNIIVQAQSATPQAKYGEGKNPNHDVNKPAAITYKIIPSVNASWGYDIYVDNKITIHQPSKPCIPGNEGFKNKDDAIHVAELVMRKMKKGEMPPTLTKEELKRIGAI